MKDIGYYAGFLKPETQEAIRNAHTWQLCLTLSTFAEYFADKFYYLEEEIQEPFISLVDFPESGISDRDQLAIIRGLCDRIEIKLMEQAK